MNNRLKQALLFFFNSLPLLKLKKVIFINQFNSLIWNIKGKPLPPPHSVKQKMIKTFIRQFGYKTFVETGTYLGAMIYTVLKDFSLIYTIELSEVLQQRAVKLFKSYKHVHCLQGDSGKVLQQLAPKITEGSIFWLDGHYSSGITALGDKICPVFEELTAIIKYDQYNHIILIDDARLFINKEQEYPPLDELVEFVNALSKEYNIALLKTDTIVITKATLNGHPYIDHYIQSV